MNAREILDSMVHFAGRCHEEGSTKLMPDERNLGERIAKGAPFIQVMMFHSAARPGTRVKVWSWIVNPSAKTYSDYTFATLAFGVPGFGKKQSLVLHLRDVRWPHLSSKPFTLSGNEAGYIVIHEYVVPTVLPGYYHGSVLLWREGYDVEHGQCFGRGFFYFEVLA